MKSFNQIKNDQIKKGRQEKDSIIIIISAILDKFSNELDERFPVTQKPQDESIEVNMPFERLPTCAHDEGKDKIEDFKCDKCVSGVIDLTERFNPPAANLPQGE